MATATVFKSIRVELQEREIVSIAKTDFENWKRHREIIDYHIELLCFEKRKITMVDLETIRGILKKIKDY